MSLGWIKLYRSLLVDPVWTTATADQKAVLVTVLLLASHESRQWAWEGQKFEVLPGQFVTSLAALAKAAGVSVTSVRSAIARFERLDFLTNRSTKTGRLISLTNWGRYQSVKSVSDKDTGKDPTKPQQLSRSQEGKTKTYSGDFFDLIPPHLLTENFVAAWDEWLKFRREIKKPVVRTTAERQLKALANYPVGTAITTLAISIEKGWTGLFPEKVLVSSPPSPIPTEDPVWLTN